MLGEISVCSLWMHIRNLCTAVCRLRMAVQRLQTETSANCLNTCSTLRMELHRTAGNAPALWSGKTSMIKGFGKERSGYLPSPNKPRTNLMTAGCFRGRVSWGSKKRYCFYLVATKPRRHFHKGRVRLLLIFLPASEEQIDCLLFLLGVCRAEDKCGGTDGDDV